jgi:hypothetical protein
MADNQATRAGNITKFDIQSTDGTKAIDISAGVVELNYYENILSNSISMTATVIDTGFTDSKLGNVGIVDGLPLRGGELSTIVVEDNQPKPNKLEFKTEKSFYINRVRDIDPGTQKDLYSIDFAPREYFANEQSRVVKRYDGNISDNIRQILTKPLSNGTGLLTQKNVNVDDTLVKYNFIGNDRKPFYVCTWLASKSIPKEVGKDDGAAGYLFYETYDGYNFRSIDALFAQKYGDKNYKKKYIYNNTESKPNEYDDKVLSYNIERDIDLGNNLTLGTYANRSIFFDFYAMDYRVRQYSVDDNQKDKIVNGGLDEILSVSEEFRKPVSRLMNHVLDVGTLPAGKDANAQLETWKNTPFDPTYDAARTMVQSVMRYNQMFLIKVNVIVPGDFSLRAGDLVYCDFPGLTVEQNKQVNKQSGGIYMIASLCHRITPRVTFTSMTLVRDSFGRKPFK